MATTYKNKPGEFSSVTSAPSNPTAAKPVQSSSTKATKAKKSAPRKPSLAKDPFRTVSEFRESIKDTIDKLHAAGDYEAADVLRALRKQIDLLLPQGVAAREKRIESDAIYDLNAERRQEAVKKARAA